MEAVTGPREAPASQRRFNIPLDTWHRAVDELFELLVDVARRRGIVAYGDVVSQLRIVTLEPDSSAFHHMLGEVSARAFDEGAPLLSAVVVHKHDGRPGGGFCDLARRLGFEVGDGSVAQDIFWAQQLQAVHAWWRRR